MGRKKTVEFDESPPDDFDPEHPYKDPVAMLEMREHIIPLAASAGARMDATHPFMVLKWSQWNRSESLGGITVNKMACRKMFGWLASL
ncbi:NADH dehydrogenase [ubiquinone] 1 beta subcomplex subunit 10-B, partial [Cucurbita argyrosperma subsp. sororia]